MLTPYGDAKLVLKMTFMLYEDQLLIMCIHYVCLLTSFVVKCVSSVNNEPVQLLISIQPVAEGESRVQLVDFLLVLYGKANFVGIKCPPHHKPELPR